MAKWEERSLIEKWGAVAVALTGILTLVFLLFPDLKPEPLRGTPAQSSTPVSPVADLKPSPGDVILGTWQQYGLVPATSQWEYFGTFVVAKVNGAYAMSAREQKEDPQLLNSIGIFDVQSDGTSWSFNSNWGRGAVGNFLLQKVSNTVFEGTISVSGRVVGQTKWVRTQ
jgi:hypothetical protein